MSAISVIMGVYNTCNELMLRCSIESILHQSMEDLEFIICDDGSTDGTYELLSIIAKSDKRIRLIKNDKNMGLAATLNRCIDLSHGQYIARQDADDYSVSDRFKKQIDFLINNKSYDLVGSNVAYFDDNGVWGEYRLKAFPEKADFLFSVPFIHGAVMFRKKALLRVNKYRVAKQTRRAEDYDLFMRMYSKGLRAANIQENLYCFREDKKASKRRKYRYRIDEMIVRYNGFKNLGLLPRGYVYVFKPLLVGTIPTWQLNLLKDIYYQRKIR